MRELLKTMPEDARRHTDLVKEQAEMGGFNGEVEVRVCENHAWALSSQLQGDAFQIALARRLRHNVADLVRQAQVT